MNNRKVIPFNEVANKTQNEVFESKSLISEVMSSVKYMFQSAQGKYSLETYLEILSEFTDSEIMDGEEKGLKFVGGEVRFKSVRNDNYVSIVIELEFQDGFGEWRLKKAERKIEKDRFVEETVQRLENEEETIFNVEKPK